MRQWPKPKHDSEPEIIPPGAGSRSRSGVWVAHSGYGYRRVYVSRIGPLGLIFLGVAIGALSLFAILLLVGAVLIWLPIIGLIALAAIVSSVLRGPSRHPR
jgi:hypothetical protein